MCTNRDVVLRPAEEDFLRDMVHKVRLALPDQVRQLWPSISSARNVARLKLAGLIETRPMMVHPELGSREPVVRWRPGQEAPPFGAVSHMLRSRWHRAPVSVVALSASALAARMFGGYGGRRPRESEETHDIHLTSVYVHYRLHRPRLAELWIGEEAIKRHAPKRRKIPDAMLGINGRVIEFGGAYKKQKLMVFHEFCRAESLEYEVW